MMPNAGFDPAALEQQGWGQGSVFESVEAVRRHAPQWVTVGETDWLIVTSHDCDVVGRDLKKEPHVEVLCAKVIGARAPDGQLAWGRNPRSLQCFGQTDEKDIALSCYSWHSGGRVGRGRDSFDLLNEMHAMTERQSRVIKEIHRRAAAGQSLKSGDNRGDWLYAAAVQQFGSWGKAVQASGFKYRDIKTRPLTKTEVRKQLRELIKTGEPVLAKDHPELRGGAVRHFGSWRAALAALGQKNPAATRWTKANVLAAIRKDIEAGLPVTSNQMRRRNENLYAAGRRRFGSWAAALKVAHTAVR